MIKHTVIAAALGSLALCTQSALAQQFNGGMPAGWTCVGTCGTSGADGVVEFSPVPSSTQYGWVSTDQGVNGISPLDPAPTPFGGNANGSTLTSAAFFANAGDHLSFYFNFVTTDGIGLGDGYDFKDYGWSRLLNAADSSQASALLTARTEATSQYIIPGQGLPPSEATLTQSSPPAFSYSPILEGGDGTGPLWTPLGQDSGWCWGLGCGYSGWIQANYTFAATGTYQLEFGVTNWIDPAFNSGMAIDGIAITPGNGGVTSPVPEPETYAMLLAGLGLLSVAARRRKQRA